jgi:N-acetylmuramic acid 6-phosphate etherase
MVRLGKTYGNLMVDLRTTNAKLRDRSIRILQSLTGFDRPNAIAQLEAANGELKTAIVTALTGISPQEGRERLRECEGILRRVLERR